MSKAGRSTRFTILVLSAVEVLDYDFDFMVLTIKRIIHFSLIFFLTTGFSSCQKKEKTLDDALQKSVKWMWQQQSADGGWHSQTHAVLRDGVVLTPYILFYLLQLPEEKFPIEKEFVNKAVDFINASMRSSMDKDSVRLVDYPNYSASYALRVLHRLDRDTSLQLIIANYLIHQQFTEQRGFTSDSLVYGGWGYGEPDLKKGEHGHADLSHTRRITQALNESGLLTEKMKEDIVLFINGVQRNQQDPRRYEGCLSRTELPYDGGFVSSVVTLATNKSQPVLIDHAGYHYPSYATATCDGFLAMEALHMNNTASYKDAVKWLEQNQHVSYIDGLSTNDPEQWTYIMHYYHLSVRSEALSIIHPEGPWRDSISLMLINEQLPEGNYINPLGGVNKEDDPLMATIFCIQAGGIVLHHERKNVRT